MSVVFRAEDEPVASRVDFWRYVAEETIAPLDLRILARPDFRAQVRAGQMGAVHVTEVTGPPAELARTRTLIRRSDPDLVKIDLQARGQMVVEQDGRQARLGPGDFAFADLSRPGHWVNSAQGCVVVMFPRNLLPLGPDETSQLTGRRMPGDVGVTKLVSSLARELPRHLDERSPADGARLGTALVDLLAVALAARLDRRSVVPLSTRQRALLVPIHAFIEAHLADPGLSPRTIAAANHVSVRYLHKLFEAEGATVGDWIRQRRLDRCCRDLLDPVLSDRPVSAIGARWGFTDPAQFSRTFRAAYGVPPGDFRRSAHGSVRD